MVYCLWKPFKELVELLLRVWHGSHRPGDLSWGDSCFLPSEVPAGVTVVFLLHCCGGYRAISEGHLPGSIWLPWVPGLCELHGFSTAVETNSLTHTMWVLALGLHLACPALLVPISNGIARLVWCLCWHWETQWSRSLSFGGSLHYGGLEHSRPRIAEADFHLGHKLCKCTAIGSVLPKYRPQEKHPDENVWCSQKVLFCFVAIAVTAILCESKLWLWPEMTPVGDGCRKKEAASVELASARSRTQRAMEEVDF